MNEAGRLLRRVVDDVGSDPWRRSTEGLDDCCMFCGSFDYTYDGQSAWTYYHDPDCVWFAIHDLLGLTVHADHQRRVVEVVESDRD